MDDAMGEAEGTGLRVAFDRRLKLEFHGASVTSDAGLLAFRELDDALGLTAMAAEVLADTHTGRNGRHSLDRPASVFGRLAGYGVRTVGGKGQVACRPQRPLADPASDQPIHRNGSARSSPRS